MLPLRPLAVVAGQIAVPVVLATCFQFLVLILTTVFRPIPPTLVLAVVGVLLPMNVLVFALDNLIFLWYPFRSQREGIEVFIRAVLTLTFKGLLFAGVFVIVMGWSMLARYLADVFPTPVLLGHDWRATYLLGLWLIAVVSAVMTTWLLVDAFQRFDPGQDVPAR